jgi:hypothetical protein
MTSDHGRKQEFFREAGDANSSRRAARNFAYKLALETFNIIFTNKNNCNI